MSKSKIMHKSLLAFADVMFKMRDDIAPIADGILVNPENPAVNKLIALATVKFIDEHVCPLIASIVEDEDVNYDSMPIPQLASELRNMKEELDLVGAVKTDLQKRYDYLSIDIIPDRMDEEGVDSIKVAGVGRLQTSSDIRCNVLAVNREPLQNWLRDNGHEAMIAESVNSSTLKAFVKERMKEEKPYPKDLLQITPFSRATVVKG